MQLVDEPYAVCEFHAQELPKVGRFMVRFARSQARPVSVMAVQCIDNGRRGAIRKDAYCPTGLSDINARSNEVVVGVAAEGGRCSGVPLGLGALCRQLIER